MDELIHGFGPSDIECPYCHAAYGCLLRTETGELTDPPVYQCWCGAKCTLPPEA